MIYICLIIYYLFKVPEPTDAATDVRIADLSDSNELMSWQDTDVPAHPETVTVTLTQNPGEGKMQAYRVRWPHTKFYMRGASSPLFNLIEKLCSSQL